MGVQVSPCAPAERSGNSGSMTIDAVIAEAVGMSNNEDVAYAYLYRQSLNYLTSERFALAEAIERSRELGQNPSYQRLAKRIRMLASMANA